VVSARKGSHYRKRVTRLHATGLVIVTPAKRAGAWCVRAFAVLIRLSAKVANVPLNRHDLIMATKWLLHHD
jgi:hypothetical protein